MQIIWTEDAIHDYHQNIDYLLEKWTEQVAMAFVEDWSLCLI